LFDRFLPVLASNLDREEVIIDVGANVGDTVIALAQNCLNPILAIEPSDIFFAYLANNLRRLSSEERQRISTVKQLVGTGLLSGELVHSTRGTAGVSLNDAPTFSTHTPLDSLVDDVSRVLLLKVDTDGFDFDVIQSARKILSESEPILFWENQVSDQFQYDGFNGLCSLLQGEGYESIYVFDNYGNILLEEVGIQAMRGINSYLLSMAKLNCQRTFWYVDVLATTKRHAEISRRAVRQFRIEWIGR
jgi:FkbM family methyltransferase